MEHENNNRNFFTEFQEAKLSIDASQLVKESRLAPLNAPNYFASSFRLASTGTEILLVIDRAVPMVDGQGVMPVDAVLMMQTVATISLSPGSAKDLSLVLTDTVSKHEEQFGEIVTPFSSSK